MRLYLVGMPGCGKSYLGRQIAEEKQFTFIDLDKQIEEKAQSSIAELFIDKGEAGFRALESEILKETASMTDAVIAPGGGAPCFYDNMQWINDNGTSIYLKTSPAILAGRLWPVRNQRPLLQGCRTREDLEAFIEQTLAQRELYYEQGDYVIETNRLLITAELTELLEVLFN